MSASLVGSEMCIRDRDIWVEACEGLGLPPGALILLRVPVYGLGDAPAEFRRTVARYLKETLNFKAALLEPC
eukprot:4632859-Alexandrium_andersonii.AAC.1